MSDKGTTMAGYSLTDAKRSAISNFDVDSIETHDISFPEIFRYRYGFDFVTKLRYIIVFDERFVKVTNISRVTL